MIIFDNCQLEIDEDRGVIYVHGPIGATLLRICKLPRPIAEVKADGTDMLDISFEPGVVSWSTNKIVRGVFGVTQRKTEIRCRVCWKWIDRLPGSGLVPAHPSKDPNLNCSGTGYYGSET